VAKTTYAISSQRAGVGSVIIAETTSQKTYVTNTAVIQETALPLAAGRMDGQAQVSFAGDVLHPGAAQMDGQAQVAFAGAIRGVGMAEMDGQAHVAFTGMTHASGTAAMDGAASMLVPLLPVARGQMDGAASMIAVGASDAPGVHVMGMLQNIRSSEAMTTTGTSHIGLLQNMTSSSAMVHSNVYHISALQNFILSLTPTLTSTKFGFILRDRVVASHSSGEITRYHWVATNPIFIHPSPVPGHNVIKVLVQNLTVAFSALEKFTWGRALVQAFSVHAAASVLAKYATVLTQLFKFADGFSITRALTLQQNLTLHPSQLGAFGLKLLQRFLVASTSSPVLTYHFGLVGQIIVKDILARVTAQVLTQLFNIHPVGPGHQFITSNALAQLLTVHPAFTNKLVLKIIGNLQLSPSQLVNMLYKGDPLLDDVTITALYISPSGTTTAWAVNTRTNAVTEYMNYNFRSFALLGDRYIAAGSGGLYELVGDTDNGASIVSELMSGYLQLNEKKLFGIKGAYVAIRGGGRFYLKLLSGDGREYVYELKAQPNLMTTKVRIGKGIRTTYMAFDLVTEGQDWDLDSIEFIPMTSGRRV
jgi:hypothetical protein